MVFPQNLKEKLTIPPYPFSYFVNLTIEETVIGIKMLIFKSSFANEFVGKFSFQVHEEFQHLQIDHIDSKSPESSYNL